MLRNTGQDFAVINFQYKIFDTQITHHLMHHQHNFGFAQQRIRSHNVGIALVKLPVATFLGSVGPPNGLHLIAFEREGKRVPVHNHIAGKRHRKVITKPLFSNFREHRFGAGDQIIRRKTGRKIARIQDFEQQLVALIAIFTSERAEVFH